ncbi:glycosyltransferase [Frigoriglobus tundricola]|uniref:Poly-beta-1,6-N-acetyl-D-glucosamine synthase n=1 Tax=Frigoriglobus tundricola TaxID=2774151 RepID=A0A6M5YFM8_9BACT|nr:glycosyltransferase [Frigoriglobus tundricola]QJW92788.1 Poly-beta-1,6-N-acetyl-D-glucosamine synthase [Frigoriglobus tundricola]
MLTAVASLAFLIPATIACLYYVAFTLAARRARPHRAASGPTRTFAVLIPAHNEQDALPATLRSVLALDYPPEMVRVYVVADNCTDRTADVAAEAGVMCLVRDDPARRGKGFALEFGLNAVSADGPDAVLVLDADCTLDPCALWELDATFATGAEAAQLTVRSANADAGATGYVAAVGDAVDGLVAAGRDRLGFSVPLRGTGMAFSRNVLTRVPWVAFSTVEDAEYAVRLRAAGIRIRLAAGARVFCAAPPQLNELCRQRRRWRSALFTGGRAKLPVRAVHSKPLVLVHLFVTAAGVLAAGEPALVVWAAWLVGLTAAVYLRAMAAVGLTPHRIALLVISPVVIARLAWVTAVGVFRRPASWDATSARADRLVSTDAPALDPKSATDMPFARRPSRVMRLLHRPFVRSRNEGSPFVSLTFDDGPHPVHTPEVLARLQRYRIPATFFLVGKRVADTPHFVERITAAGHTVGNHTFSHPRFGRFGFMEPRLELERCRELVPGATKFRPPFGLVTPGVWFAARRLGLPVVTWSVDSGDWQCRNEVEAAAAARQVLELVRPGDIVLLHDDRPWIGVILDVLLPGLAARGLLGPVLEATPEQKRAARPARALASR